jgi:anti-anti-sigma factor
MFAAGDSEYEPEPPMSPELAEVAAALADEFSAVLPRSEVLDVVAEHARAVRTSSDGGARLAEIALAARCELATIAGQPQPSTDPGPVAPVRVTGGAAVISLTGAFDFDSRSTLDDALGRAVATGAPVVLVDCAHLSFCDCAALGSLVVTAARLAAEQRDLACTRVGPGVRRMVGLLGLDATLHVLRTPPHRRAS